MPKGVHTGHRRGLDHPVAQAWVPPCDEPSLRAMYEGQGMTQQEIADALATSLKRVQTAMRRFRIKPRRAIKRDQRGEKNATWKGAFATYAAFHKRVEVARGTPRRCDDCGTSDPEKSYDWANLTGRYDDVEDYRRLCRSCHRQYDAARRKGVVSNA